MTNEFIQLSNLLANSPILFVNKKNKNFCFYINFYSLNNLIIKNQYILLLITKLSNYAS